MAYIKPINGYVVDVPNATFIRCDGKRFYYNKLASCNFSPTIDPLTITGGQGLYPLAYISAGATAEITMTSAEFRADLFELAHAVTAVSSTNETIYETKNFDVQSGLTISLPAGATNIYIPGLEQADVLAAGKYTVADTTVTFNEGDVAVGDTISVSYQKTASGVAIPVGTDGASAKGTIQLEYPVYSSGTDCSESSRKGTLYLIVYRVRVSAMPGFDTSLTCRLLAA